jgi:hypothetical protein
MPVQNVVNALGYAGLIPFVASAALVTSGSAYAETAGHIADLYAFGIICFLAGSWWGMNCANGNRAVILLSNIYFVLAFLILTLTPGWWPLAASILLIAIFATESNKSLFPGLSAAYRKMRSLLTLISAGSMFSIHFLG